MRALQLALLLLTLQGKQCLPSTTQETKNQISKIQQDSISTKTAIQFKKIQVLFRRTIISYEKYEQFG